MGIDNGAWYQSSLSSKMEQHFPKYDTEEIETANPYNFIMPRLRDAART